MQKAFERFAAGGIALGERPRSVEYFPGARLRLRHRDRSARHSGEGDETGLSGLVRNVARHREDVRRRREGGGIQPITASFRTAAKERVRRAPSLQTRRTIS